MQEQQPPPPPLAPPQAQTTTTGPKPRGRRKKIRTEPIRPICPQCEKQFSNQSALTKHKLTHSDERKFACQQCSKAFKRHDHLTGHMQTHSNRKPYNCTIQGCDKTYCDARSLRRHKENIHHIVTPREQQHHHHHQQQQLQQQEQQQEQHDQEQQEQQQPEQQQPEQQNNEAPGSYNGVETHQVVQQTFDHVESTDLNNNRIVQVISNHQHAPFSADYASTQHFNFDFSNGQMDHAISSSCSSIPHSAGSITDSGLGLNAQYEQYEQCTPNLTQQEQQAPPTTHPNQPQGHQSLHQQQQQQPQPPQSHHVGYSAGYATTQNFDFQQSNSHHNHHHHHHNHNHNNPPQFQPSHLLRRRIQRLHSDSGTYLACSTTSTHNNNNNRYLSNHQHASFSADYASTQHFNFDFSNGQMNHAISSSSSSIPLSAGSIADSGLGLNAQYEQYEQCTPNHPQQEQQAPPTTHPNQQQGHQSLHQLQPQPQPQHYHHQSHHVSYSAGYATTQHFDYVT